MDELNLLIMGQESAVIQILIEAAVSSRFLGKGRGILEESRTIICQYIHKQFIGQTLLAKLVHFQTYPLEMIPVLVEGVPSMHVCLEYVEELLQQPTHRHRVFGVHLSVHLLKKFPLVKK